MLRIEKVLTFSRIYDIIYTLYCTLHFFRALGTDFRSPQKIILERGKKDCGDPAFDEVLAGYYIRNSQPQRAYAP